MDPIKNPFSPGAGSPPPELSGRDKILEHANILLKRIYQKRSEKSLLLTGLRGVGKTVLLNEIDRMARLERYPTLLLEVHEGKSLPALLAQPLRNLLFELDRMASFGQKAKEALTVLKSFANAVKVKIGDIELGLDLNPKLGGADSGDIEVDLPDLFLAVAEAAEERKTLIVILIDEIQYCNTSELSALIMAMHKMQQKQLPLVLIAAGLPILPGLAGDSKSYAERLFSFPDIGPLCKEDVFKALQQPVENAGASFESNALEEIYRVTKGYPYFLQEWGYQAWNHSQSNLITLPVVEEIHSIVVKRLDENFFKVRFDRLTPKEKKYLLMMAELGKGPYKTSDIASKFGTAVTVSSLAPVRSHLIKKGMIYSTSHGEMAFTVPLFDEFMRRVFAK